MQPNGEHRAWRYKMKELIPCRIYASFALLQAPSTQMWNKARLSYSPFLGSSLHCMVHLRMTGCWSLYSVIHQSFTLCSLIMTNLLLHPRYYVKVSCLWYVYQIKQNSHPTMLACSGKLIILVPRNVYVLVINFLGQCFKACIRSERVA